MSQPVENHTTKNRTSDGLYAHCCSKSFTCIGSYDAIDKYLDFMSKETDTQIVHN